MLSFKNTFEAIDDLAEIDVDHKETEKC